MPDILTVSDLIVLGIKCIVLTVFDLVDVAVDCDVCPLYCPFLTWLMLLLTVSCQ